MCGDGQVDEGLAGIDVDQFGEHSHVGRLRDGALTRVGDASARGRAQGRGQPGVVDARSVHPGGAVHRDLVVGAVHQRERPSLEDGLPGGPGDRPVGVLRAVDADHDAARREQGLRHVTSLVRGIGREYGRDAHRGGTKGPVDDVSGRPRLVACPLSMTWTRPSASDC